MKTYAHIVDGTVVELFQTDGDITTMFHPSLLWVDITSIVPQVLVGWSYVEGQFSAVAPSNVPIDQLQANLCNAVDIAADNVYASIGGSSPGRLAEYRQAFDDATAFKTAGYPATVPPSIQCWATAQNWTPQQAADDILQTAASWIGALEAIRTARLIGKAAINSATTEADAQAACDAAVANVQSAAL